MSDFAVVGHSEHFELRNDPAAARDAIDKHLSGAYELKKLNLPDTPA